VWMGGALGLCPVMGFGNSVFGHLASVTNDLVN
jgi:hypothetical protein